jgi:hypothetical protein
MKARRPPSVCPVCSADVPPNAKACPECGACDKSGWSEDAASDGAGLSEEEFDYDRFVEEEFGGGAKKSGGERFWWIVAVIVLLAFVWLIVRGS